MERIKWEIRIREGEIMHDNDTDKITIEIYKIINDFINTESNKAMERIIVYEDVEFNGQIHKNRKVCDYSIVMPKDQFPNIQSILFTKENLEIIMHYYFEYISFFPIPFAEFEKSFFSLLTFVIEEDVPVESLMQDSDACIKAINEIVKMRYFDFSDQSLLSFLYVFSIDSELQKRTDSIYEKIKSNYDCMIDQCNNMAS
jgi:hypothetical protein